MPLFDRAVRAGAPIISPPVFDSNSAVIDIVADAAGNSYITGYIQGTVAFGQFTLSTNSGYDQMFVAKLDPAGNYVWAVLGGSVIGNEIGNGIALDAAGNIYITGDFTGPTAVFGNTVLTNSRREGESSEVYVAKLTPAGQWVWAVATGNSDGGESGNAIALDPTGNVYITGHFSSARVSFGTTTLINAYTPQSDDLFVAKLDGAGNWLWAVRGGGTGLDGSYDIAVDAAGNAYITGGIQSRSAMFGTLALTLSGGSAAFVAKLNPAGNYVWAVLGGDSGTGSASGNSIALDAASNLYATGSFSGNGAVFGNFSLGNAGLSDVYVTRLDAATGTYRWAVRAGGPGQEISAGLVADTRGVYVGGGYEGASFQAGTTSLPYTGRFGHDMFVAKLDPAGSWLWATRAYGIDNELSLGLSLDARANLYVGGYYGSPTVTFDSLILPGNPDFANGSGFVARLPAPPTVQIRGDSAVCNGGQVQLSATATANVLSYRWSTGATTPSIIVTQPGTYSVTTTFSGGFTSTDQFQVRSLSPTVRISGDTLLCAGAPLTLAALAPGALSYLWSTGATTATISPTQPGTYTVTAAYGAGCAATAQHTVRAPSLRIDGGSLLCGPGGNGSSLVMTAIAPGATAFRWNTGTTTPALTVAQPGTYTVTATFANGCQLTAQRTIVRPTASISGDTLLCPGRSVTLAAALADPQASYRWNTGATTPSITVAQPGIYSVLIGYGPAQCTATAQIRVQPAPTLPVFSLGADTTLCLEQPLVLRAPSFSGPGLTRRWSDGSTASTLRVTEPGTYSLSISTPCESRTVTRRVEYVSCLFIPNIITPNGDGQNDRFFIRGLPRGDWQLEIYNRWGRAVYQTGAYHNDWGTDAAPGVYYYLLRQGTTSCKGWLEVTR